MIATHSVLEDLINGLKRIDVRSAKAHEIQAMLVGSPVNEATLAPVLYFEPQRYTRNLIYRDRDFELLVVCWAEGSRSGIHDHGGSRCFMAVQSGALTVEDFAVVDGEPETGFATLTQTTTSILGPSEIDSRSPGRDIHRVGPASGRAVSLHVYAKALDKCMMFDQSRGSCRTETSRYDTIRFISSFDV